MRMSRFLKSVLSLWLSAFFVVVVATWHEDSIGYTAFSLLVASGWFVLFLEEAFKIGSKPQ